MIDKEQAVSELQLKENIKRAKQLIDNKVKIDYDGGIECNPQQTNNQCICMSFPVALDNNSKKVLTIPVYMNVDQYDGKILFNFDRNNITSYTVRYSGIPMLLNPDNTKTKFTFKIEEISIVPEELDKYEELRGIKITNNEITDGNKFKYSSDTKKVFLYIDKELTINRSKNSLLNCLKTNTYAFSVRPKWILSNMSNTVNGTMHVYIAYLTNKQEYLKRNFLYIQIKNKINVPDRNASDIMGCTSKLYKLTASAIGD